MSQETTGGSEEKGKDESSRMVTKGYNEPRKDPYGVSRETYSESGSPRRMKEKGQGNMQGENHLTIHPDWIKGTGIRKGKLA